MDHAAQQWTAKGSPGLCDASRPSDGLAGRPGAIDNARVPAWPIEELLFRPTLTVLLAASLPFATARILAALLAPRGLGEAESARGVLLAVRSVRWIDGAFAAVLGCTALAPAISPSLCAAGAMGLVAGGLSAGASVIAGRRIAGAAGDVAIGARGSEARTALAAALVVGLALPLVAVLAERLTRIEPDAIASTSADAARRRLRIDPRDGAAMLSTAWSSADHSDLALASQRIDEAERMGAPPAELEEARAEVAAREGDCTSARGHFDRALELRAELAFERGELELGGYHLPHSLITRCGE
jgi:hypothetical protein